MNALRLTSRHQVQIATTAFLFATVAVLLTSSSTAHAQGITLTFDQAAVRFSGGIIEHAQDSGGTSFCLGYSFTVDSPIAVTALGFYDDNNTAAGQPTGGTKMKTSHPVGIFDAQGNLLVQATVTPTDTAYSAYNDGTPGGTSSQLVRYSTGLKDGTTGTVSLSSFALTPGQTYSIAAVTGSDYYTYATDTFSQAAGIHYIQDQYYANSGDGNTDTLQAPTQSYGGGVGSGFFGPNFRFTPAGVSAAPEPSEWAAIGFTGLGVGGLLLRAKRRAAGHEPVGQGAGVQD